MLNGTGAEPIRADVAIDDGKITKVGEVTEPGREELDAAGQHWEAEDMAAEQGRICEPEEVSAAVLFLASDEASFINGTALYVDNGWYAKG